MDAARLREAYESFGRDGVAAFAPVLAARVRWLDSPERVIPAHVPRAEVIREMGALGWDQLPLVPRNFIELADRVIVPLEAGGVHHWQLGAQGAVRLEVHSNRFAALGAATGYRALLDRLHEHLRPRTYVEIGVRSGRSLGCALPGTRLVGIDPDPELSDPRVAEVARIFRLTSDDFFDRHDLPAELGGLPVDLAFIDGMHLFEYALRDFINLERGAGPGGLILVHDVLPTGPEMAGREFRASGWTGDVWKLVPLLREQRPDLRVAAVDAEPTGLAVIAGLDPHSTVLSDRYEELVERYMRRDYEALARIDDAWDVVEPLLPAPASPAQ